VGPVQKHLSDNDLSGVSTCTVSSDSSVFVGFAKASLRFSSTKQKEYPGWTRLLIPWLIVGKVSIEGEMIDPLPGDVMVAFMSSKGGRRYFGGLKAYEKWGDIDAAFQSWAKNFRERLDKARES
jgi:hypothetical protein